MGRNLIVGDIHSRYTKLMAVLEKSGYDPASDVLYSVGDFCDRGKDAVMTLRFLMGIGNLRAVIGNHDILLQNWLYTGERDAVWRHNLGGSKTVKDILYRNHLDKQAQFDIARWLRRIPLARVEERYIIVHGGIPHGRTIDDLVEYQNAERPSYTDPFAYDSPAWERNYMLSAYAEEQPEVSGEISINAGPFDTDRMIFVGHTPTLDGKPFISERYHLVALDTGAGFSGPITLMDMDTLEYWQA